MKHLLPFLAATLATTTLSAQHKTFKSFLPHQRSVYTEAILEDQANEQAKSTAMTQRMIANKTISNGVSDSLRYRYSTVQRGAAHNPKNPSTYSDDYYPMADLYSSEANDGRKQYIFADSIQEYTTGVNGVTIKKYAYNTANKPTQMWYASSKPSFDQRFDLTYNTSSYATQTKLYQDTTSAPTPGPLLLAATQITTFNTSGKPVTDSTYAHLSAPASPYEKQLRTYNSNGLLTRVVSLTWTGSGWDSSDRNEFAYYSNNLLQKSTYSYYIGGGIWLPVYVDSLGYNGTNAAFTSETIREANSSTGVLTNSYRILAHLNTAGNWDTLRASEYNTTTSSWVPTTGIFITYNSYNNWNTFGYYDLSTTGQFATTPSELTRYYYETYDDNPTSVGDKSKPEVQYTLSPNPTNGRLNLTWDHSSANASDYRIVDASGRTILNSAIEKGMQNLNIDASDFAPGIYWLSVIDKNHSQIIGTRFLKQ